MKIPFSRTKTPARFLHVIRGAIGLEAVNPNLRRLMQVPAGVRSRAARRGRCRQWLWLLENPREPARRRFRKASRDRAGKEQKAVRHVGGDEEIDPAARRGPARGEQQRVV